MADNLKGIPFSSDDEGIDFPTKAKQLVKSIHDQVGIGTRRGDPIVPLEMDEIYVVWFAFVLGNWKALISTSRPDGRIWEVSHNKAKGESYVDSYLKTHNIAVPDVPICENHQPQQHRDGKPPWCRNCGLTEDFQEPKVHFRQ